MRGEVDGMSWVLVLTPALFGREGKGGNKGGGFGGLLVRGRVQSLEAIKFQAI